MDPIFDAYLERLKSLHADIRNLVAELPPDALDWTPRSGVNSIAVLISHIAGSERYWIGERAGNRAIERDRDSEFLTRGANAASLLALLQESELLAEQVLAEMTPVELSTPKGTLRNGFAYNTAWALWHALEHAALHVGHIEMMREWWREAHPA